MRIAVFGATGRTGRHVVDQGLARGHEVTAFVRDADRFGAAEGVIVIEGDARDPAAVDAAVADRDALIVVLSLARAEDEPAYSDAVRAIVDSAERAGVGRLVLTANNDVFGGDEVTGEFAAHAREHRRNRDALRASTLDWTVIAAPWVVDGPSAGPYRFELEATAPGRRLTPVDLATVTLDALERPEWSGHIVGVSD